MGAKWGAKMAGMSRLQETSKGFRHRWTCPRELRQRFGFSEIRRSLGTKLKKEAELRNAEAIRFMDAAEGRARRGQTITDAEIETAFLLIRQGLPADPTLYVRDLVRRWGAEFLIRCFDKMPYQPRLAQIGGALHVDQSELQTGLGLWGNVKPTVICVGFRS
jgi:hypothetical protein